jgi:hypothetical protein
VKNKKVTSAEEPEVEYDLSPKPQGRLTVFRSFEEEQEAQLAYWRGLTPEQRFEQHRILSFYVFGGYKKSTGNRLTFD